MLAIRGNECCSGDEEWHGAVGLEPVHASIAVLKEREANPIGSLNHR